MTSDETFQKLGALRLHAFARALHEQLENPAAYAELDAAERIGLLVDREWTEREGRRLTRRLQLARLRDRTACLEDIDYRHPRGLDRALMRRLATGEWIRQRQNVLLVGSTGCGKTYPACALGQHARRDGYSVVYRRPNRRGEFLPAGVAELSPGRLASDHVPSTTAATATSRRCSRPGRSRSSSAARLGRASR